MGHRFDYRARPERILAGNILVGSLFVAYSFFGQVYWQVALAAIAIALLLLPWVLVRSLAFNAHNTTYRGIPFYFHQTYGMTAMTYLCQALLVPLTFGLYYPAWVRYRREFIINHHRLGDAYFRFAGQHRPFYSAYLIAGFSVLIAALVGGALALALMVGAGRTAPTLTDQLPIFVLYGLALFIGRAFVYASLFNYVWNNTRLDQHRFIANLPRGRWVALQLENLGVILITGGLMYPWAAIRSTRCALESIQFSPAGPVDRIERLSESEGGAVSDAASEFIGLDFGL